MRKFKGFTLIELIVVLATFSIIMVADDACFQNDGAGGCP